QSLFLTQQPTHLKCNRAKLKMNKRDASVEASFFLSLRQKALSFTVFPVSESAAFQSFNN
ncbi:MAG: hypothetical protein ACI32F_06840, partial [Allobaculum sp.]